MWIRSTFCEGGTRLRVSKPYPIGVKPRVYLETTIISYLVGWLSRHDLYVAANQEFTREWWTKRRHQFDLFASAVVVKEAREGDADLASARLEFLTHVSLLEVTAEAESLKSELLRGAALPANAELDALHIAVATVHGLDYLLSWNCRHIANALPCRGFTISAGALVMSHHSYARRSS
jgi:hypothetical protein